MGRRFLAATLMVGAALVSASAAKADLLVDQFQSGQFNVDTAYATATGSTRDAAVADDFTVPAGQVWRPDSLDLLGYAEQGVAGTDTGNVEIYTDSRGRPAESIYETSGIPVGHCIPGRQCEFTAAFGGAPELKPGSYWISMQAVAGAYIWFWAINPPEFTYGAPAMWINPRDGWGSGCTTFRRLSDCGISSATGGRDMWFHLNGDLIDSRFNLGNIRLRGRKLSARANFADRGTARLSGRGLERSTHRIARAGSHALRLTLDRQSRRRLAQDRKVRVRAKVTFTARGGVPFTQRSRVTIKPR